MMPRSPSPRSARASGCRRRRAGSAFSGWSRRASFKSASRWSIRDRIGLGVTVFVSVETGDHSQDWLDRFAKVGRRHARGDGILPHGRRRRLLLRVVVSDIAGYDTFYKKLIAAVPLKNVTSRFAMEKIKSTTALPIQDIR